MTQKIFSIVFSLSFAFSQWPGSNQGGKMPAIGIVSGIVIDSSSSQPLEYLYNIFNYLLMFSIPRYIFSTLFNMFFDKFLNIIMSWFVISNHTHLDRNALFIVLATGRTEVTSMNSASFPYILLKVLVLLSISYSSPIK